MVRYVSANGHEREMQVARNFSRVRTFAVRDTAVLTSWGVA